MTSDGASTSRPRPRPLSDLAAAFGFLTLLPLGREWRDGVPPRAVGWYPWVGWFLGVSAAVCSGTAERLVGHPPRSSAVLAGALVVGGWAVLTRFLHWDGLADSADGLWGGSDRERRLEIMRDSRIGSFGAAAMMFVALVQVGAASSALRESAVWPIVLAPVVGRAAASLSAWTMPSARREGLGLTAMERPGVYDVLVWSLALLGIATLVPLGLSPVRLGVTAIAGVVAALAVPRVLAKPVGGMTGDLMGATVLIVESVVLIVGAVMV